MIKKRSIFIDNNVFDIFSKNDFCLCHYLPLDRYRLYVNRENEEFRRELCDKFYGKNREKLKAVKKSRLYPDEADIDFAVRSMHSIVISYDRKTGKNKKPGPFPMANTFRASLLK